MILCNCDCDYCRVNYDDGMSQHDHGDDSDFVSLLLTTELEPQCNLSTSCLSLAAAIH